MSKEVFQFKKFSLLQSDVTWKVGFDGILLGAWANVDGARSILDLGAGTGLLSLMSAQRNRQATITAIEIDPKTAAVAQQNFESSPWAERLSVYEGDVIVDALAEVLQFDMLISNPPFYPHGLKGPSPTRTLARAGNGFDAFKLPELSRMYLGPEGTVSAIVPFYLADEITVRFEKEYLHRTRRCDVRHKTNSKFSRSLLEFGRSKTAPERETLTVYEEGRPSEQYHTLLFPFRDPS